MVGEDGGKQSDEMEELRLRSVIGEYGSGSVPKELELVERSELELGDISSRLKGMWRGNVGRVGV